MIVSTYDVRYTRPDGTIGTAVVSTALGAERDAEYYRAKGYTVTVTECRTCDLCGGSGFRPHKRNRHRRARCECEFAKVTRP